MPDARVASSGVFSPRVLGGVLVALIFVLLLVTPSERSDADLRLTTRSTDARAAAGLAQTLGRLGWTVIRREAGYAGALASQPETNVVHAVLAPPHELRRAEIGALLGAVRRGASLLVVVQRGSALADSLGVTASRDGATLQPNLVDTAGCPTQSGRFAVEPGTMFWADGRVHSFWLSAPANRKDTSDKPMAAAPGSIDFLLARRSLGIGKPEQTVAIARGIPFGRGRVVALADADLLRNDVLRVCRWGAGVAAVRMVDWLRETGVKQTIVFDEFHQGNALQAHPSRVVGRTLAMTRGGHALLQLAVAGLVLLMALGTRVLAPTARPRFARRSPLEHVDALSRAYAQIGATRLVARRLIRGIRRRHARGTARALAGGDAGDELFLRAIATRHPTTAPHVERLLAATTRATPSGDIAHIAASAAAVDRALTPNMSIT